MQSERDYYHSPSHAWPSICELSQSPWWRYHTVHSDQSISKTYTTKTSLSIVLLPITIILSQQKGTYCPEANPWRCSWTLIWHQDVTNKYIFHRYVSTGKSGTGIKKMGQKPKRANHLQAKRIRQRIKWMQKHKSFSTHAGADLKANIKMWVLESPWLSLQIKLAQGDCQINDFLVGIIILRLLMHIYSAQLLPASSSKPINMNWVIILWIKLMYDAGKDVYLTRFQYLISVLV